jgi:ATP-dependent RNA helicase DDX24/MAK5
MAMNFCLSIEEITEDQINEIGETEIDLNPDDFILIDDFVEEDSRQLEFKELKGDVKSSQVVEGTKKSKVKKSLDGEIRKSLAGSEWKMFDIASSLIMNIESKGFSNPTEIQQKSIPHILNRMDLVGAAETGSGKTLAYGIPIINTILQEPVEDIVALIMVPTRELALQVVAHLKDISDEENKKKIVAIVGGMSEEKQQRLIGKVPQIVVATPGRLWALLETVMVFDTE